MGELERIVRATPWLMDLLRAARTVDPPDWLIGSGAVRTAVWDHLHGHPPPPRLRDVDLAFFDPDDLTPERERAVQRALTAVHPGVEWDARNQAAVHLWYGREVEPLTSTADGVATWPETASAVALRLTHADELEIVAPCGLEDLLGLVHRRNPRRVTVEEYERRLREKRIAERWPRVKIVSG